MIVTETISMDTSQSHMDVDVMVLASPPTSPSPAASASSQAVASSNSEITPAVDMGYEEHQPAQRRGSMSLDQERERRASIKAIMADTNISPMAKRRSIQHLMDGRRSSMGNNSSYHSLASSVSSNHSCSSSVGGSQTPDDMSEAGDNVDDDDMEQQTLVMMDGLLLGGGGSQQHPTTALHHPNAPRRMEQTRPPCSHYERNCTIIAACCGAAFGCRICHDDCPVLPPPLLLLIQHQQQPVVATTEQQQQPPHAAAAAAAAHTRYPRSASLPSSFTSMLNLNSNSTPEDNHHLIDRFAIAEVICRSCFMRQGSKTNNCINCNVEFGAYHCNICNLWMANEEHPYHCADCGFCRVGGADNFQHCHECGMCIDKSLFNNHNCKQGKYKSNCPVCQEYLFSSRSASHEMPCGHAIHWDCFRQLAAHDSRCPVCKKTAESMERMMPTWTAMAASVALQPVPRELARVVNMSCIDCGGADDERAWHFLGVQCMNCSSFNTVVNRVVMTGDEAHEFLEMREAQQNVADAAAAAAAAAATTTTAAQPPGDAPEDTAHATRPRRPRRRVNRRRSLF